MGRLYIVCNSKKEDREVLKKIEKQGKKLKSGATLTGKSFYREEYTEFAIVDTGNYITWATNATFSMENWINTKKISAEEFLKENKECVVIYRNGAETIALEKNTGRKAVAKCHAEDTYNFEIGAKLALTRLFPEPVREVSRYAEVGEYIKITNPIGTMGEYEKGDIFRVKKAFPATECVVQHVTCCENNEIIRYDEYVVLENYQPEEKSLKKQEQYYTGKVVCVRGNTGYTVGRIYEIKDGELKDDDGYIRPQGWHIKKLEDYTAVDFIELVE